MSFDGMGSTYSLVHSSPQTPKMVVLDGYPVFFELYANSHVMHRSARILVGFWKQNGSTKKL